MLRAGLRYPTRDDFGQVGQLLHARPKTFSLRFRFVESKNSFFRPTDYICPFSAQDITALIEAIIGLNDLGLAHRLLEFLTTSRGTRGYAYSVGEVLLLTTQKLFFWLVSKTKRIKKCIYQSRNGAAGGCRLAEPLREVWVGQTGLSGYPATGNENANHGNPTFHTIVDIYIYIRINSITVSRRKKYKNKSIPQLLHHFRSCARTCCWLKCWTLCRCQDWKVRSHSGCTLDVI